MATPEEMLEAASELTKKRVKVRDREYENFSPAELIAAAELIEAKSAPNGPFIRVGFKGRTV
ncbi:MAG: hypothetical protein GXX85_18435 [Ignavibacteria bacterium]|nr:hypothetical protein [Ignavibacteria bacterium]